MNDTLREKTICFVKETLKKAESGHDWWHVHRVWILAKRIAEKEKNINMEVVELGALLHDIADSKFCDGNEDVGPAIARQFLENENVDTDTIEQVLNIIKHISFKNSFGEQTFYSDELDVVQDADRLDAIGAIGIARTFNYGGYRNRPIYDPDIQPEFKMTKSKYKNSSAPTINHFYEKLLLLKDQMNTETAKAMAEDRHQFMVRFLHEFFAEWNGKK